MTEIPANPKIHCLAGAIYYNLDTVFILCEEHDYRLICITHGDKEIVVDQTFATLDDAKAFFHKAYDPFLWDIAKRSKDCDNWFEVYPEKKWLDQMLSIPHLTKKGDDSRDENGKDRQHS